MNVFEELANATIGECLEILTERSSQHGDTLGMLSTDYSDNTLREIGIDPDRLSFEQKQKLFLAYICDMKHARIALGRITKDSVVDLINYQAAWCRLDASPKYEGL